MTDIAEALRTPRRALEVALGFAVMLAGGWVLVEDVRDGALSTPTPVLILGGAYLAVGRYVQLGTGNAFLPEREQPRREPKQLNPELKRERQETLREQGFEPPGSDAPPFSLVSYRSELDALPASNPFVPMYVLDASYRILDWNHAFSLAFDHTMEGRRGMSVMEWVYFLDNFDEVIHHTEKAFATEETPPPIDIEPVVYTSPNFGRIRATKRAYRVPGDDGRYVGWLVLLDPEFESEEVEGRFQLELTRVLSDDMLWSEYGMYYDHVVNNTEVYPQLLQDLLGRSGRFGITPVGRAAKVCDLGAGTGNATRMLIEEDPSRLVVAIDNNRIMLNTLQAKCRAHLRNDDAGGGVVAVKQDVSSLNGIPNGFFDLVLMCNVLYSLSSPEQAIQEAARILAPGGEVRLSGPKRDTDVGALMKRIEKDLRASGNFAELRGAFRRVDEINRYRLASRLYRFKVSEVRDLLLKNGFSEIVAATDEAYAGQAMIVCARK